MAERTFFYVSWSIYILVVLISYIFFALKEKSNIKQYNFLFIFFMLSICLVSVYANITSDYYNYKNILAELEIYTIVPFIEYIYCLLANWADYQNNLFRFYIIFPSFLILYYILKKYSDDLVIGVTFFIVVFSYSFASVIRSSFADTIFWLGLLLLITHKSKFISFICLLLMVSSLFFHKSIILLLCPCVLSIFPLRRKSLKYLLVLTVIMILVGRICLPYVFNSPLLEFVGSDSYTSADMNRRDFTPFVLSFVINSLLYLYSIYLLYRTSFLLSKKTDVYSYIYKFLFYSFILILFLFFQDISFYVYERFFLHLIIPIVILSSYLLRVDHKCYKICILLLPILILFQNLYIYMFLQRSGI